MTLSLRREIVQNIALWLLAFALSGCGTLTVVVPSGTELRLAESIVADVWYYDGAAWQPGGEMSIPQGWYILPPPKRSETKCER